MKYLVAVLMLMLAHTFTSGQDSFSWQVRGVSADIELTQIPDMDSLRLKLQATLQDLRSKGLQVPDLAPVKLYKTDSVDDTSIIVIVDGHHQNIPSNQILGSKVRCFWDSWGIALAYTLVKHFNGRPSLHDQEEGTATILSQETFLKKAEAILGKRF